MERGNKKIVGLEEGWSFVATGLSKIRRTMDGGGEGFTYVLHRSHLLTLYLNF
jgi:hypothetical protein